MSGKLIILSAPSGAGKTTLVKHLLTSFPKDLEFSISATTREPRGNEVHQKDYYFLSKADFLHRIANHEFIEFEEVYGGAIYGTLRSEVERIWEKGKHVIFDVDVVGALRLKRKYSDQAMSIFIEPPSLEVLRKRLIQRGTDPIEAVEKRIIKAKKELTYAPLFDVVLENDELEKAYSEISVFVKYFMKGKICFCQNNEK